MRRNATRIDAPSSMVPSAVIVAIDHKATGVRFSAGFGRCERSTKGPGNRFQCLVPIRPWRDCHTGVFAVLHDRFATLLADDGTKTGSEVFHRLKRDRLSRRQELQQVRGHGLCERPGIAFRTHT